MPTPSQQNIRINLAELKAQIVMTVGLDRATRYFNYLNRFLTQKLSKSEFDKLCYLTLGGENLDLHNQLIRSVFRNACSATVPPPLPEKEAPKSIEKKDNLHFQSGFSPASICSNGNVFSASTRKVRSGIRDRRCKDRPSPMLSNGKTAHQSNTADYNNLGKVENGEASLVDLDRPMQLYHGLAERPNTDSGSTFSSLMKRPRVKQSLPYNSLSVRSIMEEEEEITDGADSCRGRSPLRAPLGITFCSASVGGAHRGLPTMRNSFISSAASMELSDTITLRKRMEQIAGAEGLEGVSLDCANLLNNGLDVYLKRLIRSCIELVGPRSGQEQIKQYIHRPQGKVLNGALPGHHVQKQSSGGTVQVIPDSSSNNYSVSMLDFKSAIELYPQQLGEDWPLLLEKICLNEHI